MARIWSVLALLLIQGVIHAGDWPQWLGPRRDGSTDEKVAPWKKDLVPSWKEPAGEGHSSPVVAKGRVFLHTAVKGKDKKEENLTAFDAITGKPIWSKSYERSNFTSLFGNGPRATPSRRRRQGLHLRHHRRAQLFRRRQRHHPLAARHAQGTEGRQSLLRRFLFAAGHRRSHPHQCAVLRSWPWTKTRAIFSGRSKTTRPAILPVSSSSRAASTWPFSSRPRGSSSLSPQDGKVFWKHATGRPAERKFDDAGGGGRYAVCQLGHVRRHGAEAARWP